MNLTELRLFNLKDKHLFWVIVAFHISCVWFLGELYGEHDLNALYDVTYSSDALMQTIPLDILSSDPLLSIYYIHIQPPMLDTVRALVSLIPHNSPNLHASVDQHMVRLWLLASGWITGLIFIWIVKLTESKLYAFLAIIIWTAYPATLSMISLLDSTLLSALFSTWLIYESWKLLRGVGSVTKFAFAAMLCFLTRTIFQWYFFPVFIAFLILSRSKPQDQIKAVVLFGIVVGFFIIKQYALYGVITTTTFSGEHKTGLLWIEKANPSGGQVWKGESVGLAYKQFLETNSATIKLRYPDGAKQFSGGYNTEEQWRLNYIHTKVANEFCVEDIHRCLNRIAKSLSQNWSEYWVESWDSRNAIVQSAFWPKYYYRVVHNYREILLLLFIVALVSDRLLEKQNIVRVCGLCVIPGYILVISLLGNRYDWYEGGRLKYILEPGIFVFCSVYSYRALYHLRNWVIR